MPDMEIYHQALNARDARFDGIFFVGITSTGIYCRPVCPAKVSYPNRRRFFQTAAAAEQAGYRPCLRCRPELAPGRAVLDAVPRLATIAAHRISAGALNGRGVPDLARELGVSERHLRRALEREIGVSPVELAQTCRLLLAKRLLAETSLPVTRIAFASGFQSLRRFNAIFRERYRMSPVALRRGTRETEPSRRGASAGTDRDYIRLSLAYRAPLDWPALTWFLRQQAIAGVETITRDSYSRTVALGGRIGVVVVKNPRPGPEIDRPGQTHSLTVAVSASLLPALMPLLVRIRQMLDLDAEPAVVDRGLEEGGLGASVRRHPGLRIPGVLDGFEAVLRVLLPDVRPIAAALGRRLDNGPEGLSVTLPDAARIAEVAPAQLVAMGVPIGSAEILAAIARLVAEGGLVLEQGSDVAEIRRKLLAVDRMTEDLAARIIMRALPWPDEIPLADPVLMKLAGVSGAQQLKAAAEKWRPWRSYAAYHLWLSSHETPGPQRARQTITPGTEPANGESPRSAPARVAQTFSLV
jgi:AraC family transcriptional regulator of adaptative response / DNA-3-methyladenine glycosylase II